MFLLKIDFEKAFDSINWGYLDSVMEQMGFSNKWRSLIHGCLSSSRASILINGSPTDEFPISKGVRQGDPLSPFLFIIAMEGLNIAIKTQQKIPSLMDSHYHITGQPCHIFSMRMMRSSLEDGIREASKIWPEF